MLDYVLSLDLGSREGQGRVAKKIHVCPNCGSKSLGLHLCRDCYENLTDFATNPNAASDWHNEFRSLYPVIVQIERAKETWTAKSELARLHEEFENSITQYQADRIGLILSKMVAIAESLESNRIQEIRETVGHEPEVHWFALVLLVTGIVLGISLYKINQWLPVLEGLVVYIIYRKAFVVCKKCKRFISRSRSVLDKSLFDRKYGSHTQFQAVNTSTQYFDNRGKMSGSGNSVTYIPYEVEHVRETVELSHACSRCGNLWTKYRTKRRNI